MKNRTLGIALVAVLLTTVLGFLLRNQIGKLANRAYYRFYDWVMGIPH